MAPDVSILVASWNDRAYLASCLGSIGRAAACSWELVIVDNGSSDGSADWVASHFPEARVIRNAANVGHCRAINQAMAAARGEYLLVLDSDTVLEPDAITALVAFMRSCGGPAIAAPRMLNPDGTAQLTARAFPTPLNGLFGRQSLLTSLFPGNAISRSYLLADRAGSTAPYEVDWVSAACMIFPRSLTHSLGLWDEVYTNYWVDADWCMRARRARARVYCVPAARVIHLEQNRRGARKSPARIRAFHRGAGYFYRKHYTRGALDPRALAASLLLQGRAGILMLANALMPEPRNSPALAAGRVEETAGGQALKG